ncbi:MAG TPA: hypothetical protein VEL76_32720, partial [Gemmataceae bacterium]|nr:hypothetical protein [Gemmataceae bacterium]
AEAEPAAHPAPEAKTEAETHDDETVLPTPHRRVVVKAGATVPLLLIFLIPYSAVATIAIGWLIYQQRTQPAPFDPLERLPDTRPDKGGARRVKFDEPLPEKLKTSLQQPLTVGDVEVTPLLVERTPLGELVLKVKLRNVSSDVAFDPLPAVFLAYDHSKKTSLKPYSFVEIGRNHLYGTSLEWKETPARPKASPFDGVLNHGEELTAVLRTPDNKEYVALVNNLDRNKGEILWRLHVRRGFVQVKGKDVSATAVVGVRINAAAIPRQAPANALLTPQARSRLPYFTIGGFQISGIF